ncbi:hypothetical protein J6590_074865 [Homalodisca vitripennis]|nr:hypothetical protein J6590_074865 [Homalodisca vitripennis]
MRRPGSQEGGSSGGRNAARGVVRCASAVNIGFVRHQHSNAHRIPISCRQSETGQSGVILANRLSTRPHSRKDLPLIKAQSGGIVENSTKTAHKHAQVVKKLFREKHLTLNLPTGISRSVCAGRCSVGKILKVIQQISGAVGLPSDCLLLQA